MGWMCALLLLAGFQDPEIDALVEKLFTTHATRRADIIEALVIKGDAAEAAVRRRFESLPEASRASFHSALHRLALQKKLRDTHPVPTPVDFEAIDRPLKDLIPELERWIGLPISTTGLPDQKVTLKVTKATPLEALDAFHAVTGLTWMPEPETTYDQQKGIHILPVPKARLVARPRSTWPAAASGRYRISPTLVSLEQPKPARGAQLQVALLIEYPARSRPTSKTFLKVGRVVDDQGRELALIPERTPSFGFPQPGRGPAPFAMGHTFYCEAPAKDARSISILGCKGRTEFVMERTYVAFDDPLNKIGTSVEAFGSKVILGEFHAAHGWMRLTLDVLGPMKPGTPVESFEYRGMNPTEFVEVVHADGRISYPTTGNSGSEKDVYYRRRMNCFGTPEVKTIRMAVRTFVAYEDFTFELRDIPLPGAK